MLPLLALFTSLFTVFAASQSFSATNIGAHEVSLPPSFPEEFTAEDLALSGVFAKISEEIDSEEFMRLCSEPDSVEKIVARVEPVVERFDLSKASCEKLEEYLARCSQASKYCEGLQNGNGEKGGGYVMSCPPDEAKLRAACESRIEEMKQKNNVAQQSTESCEFQWEKIQPYVAKTCSQNNQATKEQTQVTPAPAPAVANCPSPLPDGWAVKCRTFGGAPIEKTVGSCTVQSCDLQAATSVSTISSSSTSESSSSANVERNESQGASASSSSSQSTTQAVSESSNASVNVSTSRANGVGFVVSPFSGFATMVSEGMLENRVERFGTTVYSNTAFCQRDDFISQCKQQLQAAAISTFDDQNVQSICGREVKANLPQMQKFCDERSGGDAANVFGKCTSHLEKGCGKVSEALAICKSQLITREKVLELVRKKTALGCQRMKQMQMDGDNPLVKTARVLSGVSDNELLSEVASSEGEKLTETKADFDKIVAGDRDVVIALTKLVGLQGNREREAASQKRHAAQRLESTISSLHAIAEQVDASQKLQLEAQISALEEQKLSWTQEADNQEKFADGIFSVVKNILGG